MNLFQRLSFTALNLPTSAAGMPMFIFILPFYADDLGLGLSLVGIIFFFGRFTDILTDPVMGVLIDKFPSKWGKHKLWVFLSAPVFMLATYLIFLPTTDQPTSLYFFGSLFLLYSAFTLSSITQLSWSSFLAPDYDDRTKLLTLRELRLAYPPRQTVVLQPDFVPGSLKIITPAATFCVKQAAKLKYFLEIIVINS